MQNDLQAEIAPNIESFPYLIVGNRSRNDTVRLFFIPFP
jgi:hypothetical protein